MIFIGKEEQIRNEILFFSHSPRKQNQDSQRKSLASPHKWFIWYTLLSWFIHKPAEVGLLQGERRYGVVGEPKAEEAMILMSPTTPSVFLVSLLLFSLLWLFSVLVPRGCPEAEISTCSSYLDSSRTPPLTHKWEVLSPALDYNLILSPGTQPKNMPHLTLSSNPVLTLSKQSLQSSPSPNNPVSAPTYSQALALKGPDTMLWALW